MFTQDTKNVTISISKALKWVAINEGVGTILVIVEPTLAYLPEYPDFSIFTIYLSDIGDTPGWHSYLLIQARSLLFQYVT